MKKALQFSYSKLPRNWAKEFWNDLKIPEALVERVKRAMGKLPIGTKLFIQNNCGVIINELLEHYELSQISGIDFVSYFRGAMGKEEPLTIVDKKIMVIYNLGLEPAINLTFSTKLLKGLLKQLEQFDCIIILQSDSPYSKISREYELDITNKIRIPYKEEKEIL